MVAGVGNNATWRVADNGREDTGGGQTNWKIHGIIPRINRIFRLINCIIQLTNHLSINRSMIKGSWLLAQASLLMASPTLGPRGAPGPSPDLGARPLGHEPLAVSHEP